MKEVGARLLVKTVQGLAQNTIKEVPQPETFGAHKHAPKIFTDSCKIDWTKPTDAVYDLIRGLSPYPAAFTLLGTKSFKIYSAAKEITDHGREAGTMESDGKTYLRFACADGFIYARDVQLEGKKRLGIEEFLRGFRLP